MCATRCIAHAALICLTSLLPATFLPTGADAQECELKVRGIAGNMGYGPRKPDSRCEGMYVELQSAPVVLRLVSLIRGRVPTDAILGNEKNLVIRVPGADTLLKDPVTVMAQPTMAGVNWALDVKASGEYSWNKAELFHRTKLQLDNLGFLAVTRRSKGISDPVYVAVEVTAPGEDPTNSDDVHLIFQLPAASRARLCVARDVGSTSSGVSRNCYDAELLRSGGYYDGFFTVTLPLSDEIGNGIVPIAVEWMEAGSGAISRDRFEAVLRW